MAGGVKVAEVKDFTRIERIGMAVQQLQGSRWGCGVYSVTPSGNLLPFLLRCTLAHPWVGLE
jgi:hypothetical protein